MWFKGFLVVIAVLLSGQSSAACLDGTESATLSWTPPTQNTDGTELTDLAGYRLYYGESGTYANTITINSPDVTSYVVEGLSGTCYFVATALNADGVESDYSNESVKTFGELPGPIEVLEIAWAESDAGGGPVMPFPDDWNRRVAVVIQSGEVDATLTDFPLLLTPDNLPEEMFDADGANSAQNGGGDIRVTSDEAGTTQLAVDVVNFVTDNNPANGEAEVWTKVPSVSSSANTTVYVWYNTSGTESQPAVTDTFGRNAVWDHPRWHADEASGDLIDASGSHANFVASGTPVYGVAGPFGDAVELDDVDAVFRATADADSDFTGDAWSMGFWIKGPGSGQSNWSHFLSRRDGANKDWEVVRRSSSTDVSWIGGFTESSTENVLESVFGDLVDGTWHRVWVTGEPVVGTDGVIRLYLDGVEHQTEAFTGVGADNAQSTVHLGRDDRAGQASVLASYKEVTFFPATISAAFIAAEYSNQNTPGTFAVDGTPETPGAGGTTVEADSATHGHTADNVVLSQANILGVQSASHGHTVDGVVLTQEHNLDVADADHAQAADSVALTQANVLAPAAALHAHAADNVDLTQQNLLAVQSAVHDHAAGNITLQVAGALDVQSALHGHTADSVGLSQAHQLGVDDASHTQLADTVELSTGLIIDVADALHQHGVDNVTLSQAHILAVAEALHAQSAANITLQQGSVMAVDDALHAHSADAVGLTVGNLLAVASTVHVQQADTLALTQAHTLVVSSSLHQHLADHISLRIPGFVNKPGRVFVVETKNRTFVVARGNRTFQA